MSFMKTEITELDHRISSFTINTPEDLESYRLTFLSRKGEVTTLLSKLGSIPKQDRAATGKLVNALKQLAQNKFDQAKTKFGTAKSEPFSVQSDITLPAPSLPNGGLHPLTITMEEIKDVFFRLGFSVADGPELEDDFHNFTALNFPPEHPARDMQDTFFIRKDSVNEDEDDLMLRTHTSPVQIRLMKNQKPPIRSIMPGKVYRNEAVTYKSYYMFHQVEALYVDKNVTFAELKETLIVLARMMYGNSVKYRLRPSFFPFTEPSLELDIWNDQRNNWMEILGAGMVDPNVLLAVDIDPEVYTGFALGLGVERMTMAKYGLTDIRELYENDIRLLSQFSELI